jgi:hypothetical protein
MDRGNLHEYALAWQNLSNLGFGREAENILSRVSRDSLKGLASMGDVYNFVEQVLEEHGRVVAKELLCQYTGQDLFALCDHVRIELSHAQPPKNIGQMIIGHAA